MTHYWLRTVWPGWRGFEVRGGRRWGRFYVGLFSGKVRRNKWILAVIVVVFGWYLGETRVDIS